MARRMAMWAVAGVVGLVGAVGCQKNTPPPAPAAQVEVQPVTPPPYIPPQPPPVVVTPAEPVTTPPPVMAPEPPPAARPQPAQRPAAQSPAAQPPAASATNRGPIRPGTTYTVQRGDTLSEIAVRAYGRGNVARNVAAIKRANNLQSDMIRVGQKLRIPPRTTGNKD